MQLTTETVAVPPSIGFPVSQSTGTSENDLIDYKVIRRNGAVVGFEPPKISVAVTAMTARALWVRDGRRMSAPEGCRPDRSFPYPLHGSFE